MARAKKIEEEIKEAEIKTDTIQKEIDVNEVDVKAETISDIIVK